MMCYLVQVSYRLHRKLILDALQQLRAQQPDGVSAPGNLWEYIHEDPTKAALYVSGVLCTPRLTMLWLYIYEYSSTLGRLLAEGGDDKGPSAQAAPPSPAAPNTSLGSHATSLISANQLLFWVGWALCPALLVRLPRACRSPSSVATLATCPPFIARALMQVAHHAIRCADISVLASAYVVAICVCKQLTEWHCLSQSLLARSMSLHDKFASFVCSHAMTPALSMMLAVLHLVFSQVMPPWACSLLFWARLLMLPPLSIWASWASWVRARLRAQRRCVTAVRAHQLGPLCTEPGRARSVARVVAVGCSAGAVAAVRQRLDSAHITASVAIWPACAPLSQYCHARCGGFARSERGRTLHGARTYRAATLASSHCRAWACRGGRPCERPCRIPMPDHI